MITLRVRAGAAAGQVVRINGDAARIGRERDCEVCLPDEVLAPLHARLLAASTGLALEALAPLVRRRGDDEREAVLPGGRLTLRAGDVIEVGAPGSVAPVSGPVSGPGGPAALALEVVSAGDDEATTAQVVAVRRLDELTGAPPAAAAEQLGAILEAQRKIGSARGFEAVQAAVAEAALALVPAATHATVVLRDGDEGAYVPVMTRVRGAGGAPTAPPGPVPVVRSIVRKVLAERAAVLAADAPRDVGGSESLLGASIQSTIGVPLVRGDAIEGVLQVDNRHAPGMLRAADVDVLAVVSASASLALDNARLIERLRIAEDQLERENVYLKGREAERRGMNRDIIGRSQAMVELLHQVDRVADTRVSVLIEGDTGTGKELIASALHYRSRRRDKLFVTQNCAALPETLLESELFGHKKGSFTGATDEKKGLFELADKGTLFLDELGEMSLGLQAKLLRALQEGEVRPVGSTQVRHVDVRIVAATNRSLEDEVKAGRFREDLYYRLKVFPLRTPPLRERREDIPLLAGHFLSRYSREIGKPTGGFAQQTMELLMGYDWPGNVRELQNEVQRLVIQAEPDGIVTPDLLSPHLRKMEALVNRAGVPRGTLRDMVDSFERYILREALREHGNNKTSAARTLGITREGLHKKLRQLGID